MSMFSQFIFLIISLSCPLLYTQVIIANGSLISPVINHESAGRIGVIFDETSRSHKEAKVDIESVICDFYFISIKNQGLLLLFRNSLSKRAAALEAKYLTSTNGVKAILGVYERDEASAIAEAASDEAHDPIPESKYFADSIPTMQTFPWVLQATPSQQVQINAIAAIGQSCVLQQVTLIYENAPTLSSLQLKKIQLFQALQRFGGELSQVYTFTLFSHNSSQKELNKLTKQKQRLLTIPATLGSEYGLYQLAKNLNMTGDGYARIATPSITDLFQFVISIKLSSMLNNNGTRTYFLENLQEFYNFRRRFQSNFRNSHPDEEHDEPGIFASQASDPDRALLCKANITNLFQRISAADPGEELRLINWKKSQARFGEIINVTGKICSQDCSGYVRNFPIELRFPAQPRHTKRRRRMRVGVPAQSMFQQFVKVETDPESTVTSFDGFSLRVFEEAMNVADVNNNLRLHGALGMFDAVAGDVTIPEERHNYADFSQAYTETGMVVEVPIRSIFPAQPRHTKRRRRILTSGSESYRVGVPAQPMFQQFVKVETDPKSNVTSYDGFSLKVFEEVMKIADVNNNLRLEYYSFHGAYDDLVKQIALGMFDAVAGDVTILEERHNYADFSQAYTETGMVLVVPIRSRLPIQMWIFMNPFTTELWGLLLAITIYNCFTVWLIERKYNPEFRSGTVWNQIGTLFWPASTTLFTLSADKLHSNLSRMVMVVWLFVVLILTQSHTSILSSMLTAQRLAPATKDVATLKKMNATVGYCRGSFLKSYMINALGFDSANVKKYSSTREYAKALKTGEIAGIFLEVPAAKVFLAQYCKSFMKTEKIFKVGGYGFAFKKDFPLLPEVNRAIMKITENGKLLELEDRYINSKECAEPVLFSNEDASIGLDSFAVLFVLTGCTSTVALSIYVIRYIICSLTSTPWRRTLFKRVSAFTKRLIRYRKPSSDTVINLENPGNPSDAPSEVRQPASTTIDTESLEDYPEAPDPDSKV